MPTDELTRAACDPPCPAPPPGRLSTPVSEGSGQPFTPARDCLSDPTRTRHSWAAASTFHVKHRQRHLLYVMQPVEGGRGGSIRRSSTQSMRRPNSRKPRRRGTRRARYPDLLRTHSPTRPRLSTPCLSETATGCRTGARPPLHSSPSTHPGKPHRVECACGPRRRSSPADTAQRSRHPGPRDLGRVLIHRTKVGKHPSSAEKARAQAFSHRKL